MHGEAFNFGPSHIKDFSVSELVNKMSNYWHKVQWIDISKEYEGPKESSLLKLNCDKASFFLNWSPVWNFTETVEATINWYKNYYEKSDKSNFELTQKQIEIYIRKATEMEISWTK